MKLSRKNSKQRQGLLFEKQALGFLQKQGLKLITQNFHCRHGEIDLIMLEQDTLIFIEVRGRGESQFASASESIGNRKQQKIILSAHHFLQKQVQFQHHHCRFDSVCFDSIIEHKHLNAPTKPWQSEQALQKVKIEGKNYALNWIKSAFIST